MFYQPKKGHPFSIDPYKSLVFPRPIGWISSLSKKGIPNLAPYSFFNAIAVDPPQVMFSSGAPIDSSGYKDSLTNILTTKEFNFFHKLHFIFYVKFLIFWKIKNSFSF